MDRRKFLQAASACALAGASTKTARAWVHGSAYSAITQQFFDRLLTVPSPTRAALYASLIDGLVAEGVWSQLDGLWILASDNIATSLINLVSSSFQAKIISTSGEPVFTANSGWNGCGAPTLQAVNLNYNPSTAGGHFTQNNGMICGWKIGTNTEARPLIVNQSESGALEIWLEGSNMDFSVNTNGTETGLAFPTPLDGFWLAQRTASNAQALYQNNVLFNSSTTASAALVNETLVFAQVINIGAALAVGGSLTTGQQTTLFTLLQAYLRGVGAI